MRKTFPIMIYVKFLDKNMCCAITIVGTDVQPGNPLASENHLISGCLACMLEIGPILLGMAIIICHQIRPILANV